MPPSASKSEELTTRHTATFKSPPRPSDLSFLSLSLSSLPTTSYTQRTSSAPSQHLSHPYQTARMPVAIPTPTPLPLFPPMTRAQVEAARTSAWYPVFRRITLATTIIDLDSLGEREAFLEVSFSKMRPRHAEFTSGSSGWKQTRFSSQKTAKTRQRGLQLRYLHLALPPPPPMHLPPQVPLPPHLLCLLLLSTGFRDSMLPFARSSRNTAAQCFRS